MKKVAIAVVLSLVLMTVVGGVALAKAQKLPLQPCPVNYPGGLAGGGFVVFNNSSGPNNLQVTVSLKGAAPSTAYDIYLFVDGSWYAGAPVGTITTNVAGNANFHMNGSVSKGLHTLAIDVTLQGSTSDVYETPGIHTGGGAQMTFK